MLILAFLSNSCFLIKINTFIFTLFFFFHTMPRFLMYYKIWFPMSVLIAHDCHKCPGANMLGAFSGLV